MSQIEHSLQAAKQAADYVKTLDGASQFEKNEIVLGALFHDIGHTLALIDPKKYEWMGDYGV